MNDNEYVRHMLLIAKRT